MTGGDDFVGLEFSQPIRMAVRVGRPIADAFGLFTTRINSWWPLETHSFGIGRSPELILEPRIGRRFFERYADGEEHTNGTVLAWQPPELVAFTWQHDEWIAPTEVHVRFVAEDSNLTRVELEHRGWERLGQVGVESREMYANGWPAVIARFLEAAAAPDG